LMTMVDYRCNSGEPWLKVYLDIQEGDVDVDVEERVV